MIEMLGDVQLFVPVARRIVRLRSCEEEAVAAAEFCPDVILLDIGLPKLNGFEAYSIDNGTP